MYSLLVFHISTVLIYSLRYRKVIISDKLLMRFIELNCIEQCKIYVCIYTYIVSNIYIHIYIHIYIYIYY